MNVLLHQRLKTLLRCVSAMALASASWPTCLPAQVTAALDASASRLTYADGAGISAFLASPHLEFNRPWQSVAFDGAFAEFADAQWSMQGQARGSFFTPAFARVLRLELLGRAGGTAHQDGAQSGELDGQARLHWIGTMAGAWAGGGAGRNFNGAGWSSEFSLEAGAWLASPLGTVSLVATPNAIGDSLRFIDAELATRTIRGPFELSLFGGVRHWIRPSDATGSLWGGASAAWWLNDHIAITAAGGGYPDDYGQGLPRGRYLTMGLRVATGRSGVDQSPDLRRPLLPGLDRRVAGEFRVTSSGDGVLLEVHAPAARTVELMADFTEWTPVPFKAGHGGWWSLILPVESGIHRINLRTDGGPWDVPAGVTTVNDGFGGAVGLIAIE